MVGLPGFEPGTSCTPSKRASQAAPQPEDLTSVAERELSWTSLQSNKTSYSAAVADAST